MDGGIHPITGSTFFGAEEADALDTKFPTDSKSGIPPLRDDIATAGRRIAGRSRNLEIVPHPYQILPSEKGDLTFVVGFEIQKAVSPNASAGETFDLRDADNGMVPGRAAVMAKVAVPWRKEEMENAWFRHDGLRCRHRLCASRGGRLHSK